MTAMEGGLHLRPKVQHNNVRENIVRNVGQLVLDSPLYRHSNMAINYQNKCTNTLNSKRNTSTEKINHLAHWYVYQDKNKNKI